MLPPLTAVVCALTFLGVGFLVIHNTAPKVGEHLDTSVLANMTGVKHSTAVACATKRSVAVVVVLCC